MGFCVFSKYHLLGHCHHPLKNLCFSLENHEFLLGCFPPTPLILGQLQYQQAMGWGALPKVKCLFLALMAESK